jgi:hypothetical protein
MSEQATAEAKKVLADDKEVRAKQDAQRAVMAKAKPTPTQEECDLAALGVHVEEHEEDGSPLEKKELDAKKPAGSYQTRATEASRTK